MGGFAKLKSLYLAYFNSKSEPPFKPDLKNKLDVHYFGKEFTKEGLKVIKCLFY